MEFKIKFKIIISISNININLYDKELWLFWTKKKERERNRNNYKKFGLTLMNQNQLKKKMMKKIFLIEKVILKKALKMI